LRDVKVVNLSEKHLAIVRGILENHVPEYEIRVFGSRAEGDCKKFSDLDLAIMTREPLHPKRMARLKNAFIESNLPFKVDVLDWSTTDERFRKIIEKKYQVLQKQS
jgi:predicted nucleotidyltransferase